MLSPYPRNRIRGLPNGFPNHGSPLLTGFEALHAGRTEVMELVRQRKSPGHQHVLRQFSSIHQKNSEGTEVHLVLPGFLVSSSDWHTCQKGKMLPQSVGGGANLKLLWKADFLCSPRVWTSSRLMPEIPGLALRAFPGSFRTCFGLQSGNSHPC